jgi:hypothetical protein
MRTVAPRSGQRIIASLREKNQFAHRVPSALRA